MVIPAFHKLRGACMPGCVMRRVYHGASKKAIFFLIRFRFRFWRWSIYRFCAIYTGFVSISVSIKCPHAPPPLPAASATAADSASAAWSVMASSLSDLRAFLVVCGGWRCLFLRGLCGGLFATATTRTAVRRLALAGLLQSPLPSASSSFFFAAACCFLCFAAFRFFRSACFRQRGNN